MSVPTPPAPPAPAAPFENPTHLVLRLGEPIPRDAVRLGGVSLSRVRALDVALGGRDLAPAATMSAARLIERLPGLRELTVRFTAPPDPGQTSLAVELSRTGRSRGLQVAGDFILGADANAFDALTRHPAASRPPALVPVLDASRRLRIEGVAVRWTVPLVPALVYRLEPLFSLARDEGVDPVLVPAAFTGPGHEPAETPLDGADRLFASDFISYRLLGEEGPRHSAERAASYRALRSALTRVGRPVSAPASAVAVVYAADAEPGFRWTLDADDRPRGNEAVGDSPAPGLERFATRTGRSVGQAMAAGAVLLEGSGALAQWMRAGVADLTGNRRPPDRGRPLARVLLIGAYGGEHIGDAAILGGVLLRINRRYGTAGAVVMSQRPAHTRHLVAMLDTPFRIDVEAYEPWAIRERMPLVDAVVFAGGPLIDLPRQLVKHLYAVSRARRDGKPFIAEGIGPGPFPRWPSEWTARRIVRMADRISVRTAADDHSRLTRGLALQVGRDPAFDYLATRGRELTRLPERDRQWIERLVAKAEGRVVVGVNLRPIRHLFTAGVSRAQRAQYTRAVEARFEARCAEGLRRFHQGSPAPPCFIFFPMNAIQFGMSDLRSAYRLARALGGAVDFRVWEGDASLDGVVALLRRVDIVIAMRFHAAIFALAQERRVIGIDYRVGARDKVGALLEDAGQSENCTPDRRDDVRVALPAPGRPGRDAPRRAGPGLLDVTDAPDLRRHRIESGVPVHRPVSRVDPDGGQDPGRGSHCRDPGRWS